MGRYRKVSVVIWNDAKFRALSDDAKLVFFFLLTHPHLTSLGAMRAQVAGLAAELGWPLRRFRDRLEEARRQGMVEVDLAASYIGLPKYLAHNPPENPNVVKSWGKIVDLLPECALRAHQIGRAAHVAQSLGEEFDKALPEGFREPARIPEPEPIPIPEPNTSHDGARVRADGFGDGDPTATWPDDWLPLRQALEPLPFFQRHRAWWPDLNFWRTQDERFQSCEADLAELAVRTLAYLESKAYRPPSKGALRLKLHHCLEVEARKVDAEVRRAAQAPKR